MAIPYREGSVFVVPLRDSGYAIGVIARVNAEKSGGSILLGYFFSPKQSAIPPSEVANTLNPSKAIKIIRFGDLLLLDGTWPLIGNIAKWNREYWPLPDFVRKDDISKRAWRVTYADNDLVQPKSEQPEPYDSALERDAMYGAGAVELLLTKLLSS